MRPLEAESVSRAEDVLPSDVKFVYDSTRDRLFLEEEGLDRLLRLYRHHPVVLVDRRGELPAEECLDPLLRAAWGSYGVTPSLQDYTIEEEKGGLPSYARGLLYSGIDAGVPATVTRVSEADPTQYRLEDGTTGEPDHYLRVTATLSFLGRTLNVTITAFIDEDGVAGIMVEGDATLNAAIRLCRSDRAVEVRPCGGSTQGDTVTNAFIRLGPVPVAQCDELRIVRLPYTAVPQLTVSR